MYCSQYSTYIGIKYHGLFNRGQTSYLNSVLQVLFMTKDFREAVQSSDAHSLDGCLKTLFDDLKKHSADTSDIIKKLGIRSVDDHGDAAECFENILSRLSSPEKSQLFQGLLTYKYKCDTCGTETSTDETFWKLPLEMVESYRDYKLVDEMNRFFSESNVRGPNQLYCDHCAVKTDATMKAEMKHHPEVLTLQLKKQKFDKSYRAYVKISCSVQIPPTLQIPHGRDQCQMYELYAFVEHIDIPGYRYYTVTIKSQDDGKWYKFSDSVVIQSPRGDFNHSFWNANLLFYRKISATDTLTKDISKASSSERRDEEAAAMNESRRYREETVENRVVNVRKDQDRGTAGGKQRDEEKTNQNRTRAGNLKIADRCDQIQSNEGEGEGVAKAFTQDIRSTSTAETSKFDLRDRTGQHDHNAKTTERKGIKYHGLPTHGATSYLNSVLQVLFMTKDFREAVQRPSSDAQSLDRYLKTLFDDLKTHSADTSDIIKKLGIRSVNDEADAAECYENILSSVSSSEASQLFQGFLAHKYKCSTCGITTSTDIPFWSLPLELEESNREYSVMRVCSLKQVDDGDFITEPVTISKLQLVQTDVHLLIEVDELKKVFTKSDVRGPNQLSCGYCGAKSDATMKTGIKHPPEVLTLQLKKVKFDHNHRKCMKTTCDVQIPPTLQIPHGGSQSQMYELYAFVEHFDYGTRGYHTVTIKSQDDGKWYIFNDNAVTLRSYQPFQVGANHRSLDACLLFYRKISATNTMTQAISEASTSEAFKQETRDKREQHSHDAKARKRKEGEETAAVKLHNVDTQKTNESKGAVNDSDGETIVGKQRNEKEMKMNQNKTEIQKVKNSDLCNNLTKSNEGEVEGAANTLIQDTRVVSTSETSKYHLGDKTERDHDARTLDRKEGIKYHGLFNQGATSYINSLLQVLFMTKDFREAVQRHSCDVQSLDESLKTLFDELKKDAVDTSDIIKKLSIGSVDNQGDAAECFENILSSVSSSEASQLFQGLLTQKHKCTTCGTVTSSDNKFWSLPLELVESYSGRRVVDMVKKFFTESDVSGPDRLFCNRCAAKSEATLKWEMKHNPAFLILPLKRFKFDKYYKGYVKIRGIVEIPYLLQIPQSGGQSQEYELYAYVEHFGSMRQGSYTVYIKSQDDGKWYNFSDSSVTLLDTELFQVDFNLGSSCACLLFFRKISAENSLTSIVSEASNQGTRDKREQWEQDVKTRHRNEDEEATAMTLHNVDRQTTDESKRTVNDRRDKNSRNNGEKQRGEEKMKTDQERTEAQQLKSSNLCNNQIQSNDGEGDGLANTLEASKQHNRDKNDQHPPYMETRQKKKAEVKTCMNISVDRQETVENRVVNVREDHDRGTAGGKLRDEEKTTNQNITRTRNLTISDLCSGQIENKEGEGEGAANASTQDISRVSTSGNPKNDLRNKTEQHDHGAKTTERQKGIKYHGLPTNEGTRYLNSLLQVLFMTKDFREAVQRPCSDVQSLDRYLNILFDELKTHSADTSDIIKKLDIRSGNDQGDAAECFENILRSVSSPEASQMFQGLMTLKYKCSTCGKDASTDNPFWSLPLELEESYRNYNVVDEINKFFTEADVSEPDQLYCDQCAAKSDTERVLSKTLKWLNPFSKSCTFQKQQKLEMMHNPGYLMLHLKRFKFNQNYKEHVKIRRSAEIPYILQIPQSGTQSQRYELHAFVEHSGSVRYGSYTVTIKSQDDGKWYSFSDTSVTLLYYQPFKQDASKRSQDAYLLFYRKISETDTSTQVIGEASTSKACKRNTTRDEKEQREQDAKTREGKEDKDAPAGKRKADENKRAVDVRGDQDRGTGVKKQKGIKYHGLLNQGATCYLNSVLQVLFMTKDFREAVGRHSCNAQSLDASLNSLFEDLKNYDAYTYNITNKLGITRVDVQSDAAECLENILRRVSSPVASQLFMGLLSQKDKCSGCGRETSTDNPFWNLPLEFEESFKDYSVVEGVRLYFSESKVSGPNQLYCDHCAAKTDATMKTEMKHHPEVLTLLLKRFKFDYSQMTFVKINGSVQIPYKLEIPHNGNQSQKYELYAYVEHFGDLKSGHYTATIKSQDNDKWYYFNDSRVTELSYQQFQVDLTERSLGAYLLFYRKDINEASTSEASKQDSRDEHQQHDQDVKEDEGTAAKEHYNEKKEDDKTRAMKVGGNKDGGTSVEEQRNEMIDQIRGETHASAYNVQINQSEGYSDHTTSKTNQEHKRVVSDSSHRQHEQQREKDREVREKEMGTDGDHLPGMDVTDNGCDHLDAVQHNMHGVKDQSSGRKCVFLVSKSDGDEEVKYYVAKPGCQQIRGAHGNQNKEENKRDIGGSPLDYHNGLNGRDGEGNTNNKNVQIRENSESHCGGSEAYQETGQQHGKLGQNVIHPETVQDGHHGAMLRQRTAEQVDAHTPCGAKVNDIDLLSDGIKDLSLHDPSEEKEDGDKNMTGQAENDPERDHTTVSSIENTAQVSSDKQRVEREEPEGCDTRGGVCDAFTTTLFPYR